MSNPPASTALPPSTGTLATVRNRRGVVSAVEPFDGPEGRLHVVTFEYTDADRAAGIEAFCNQNDGDGWLLPELLRLADLGLGHDARSQAPQPVRTRMGDRFLPWQLAQSVDESWAECERHARNQLGEEGFARLEAELRGDYAAQSLEHGRLAADRDVASPAATVGTQRRLVLGEPTLFDDAMEDPPPSGRRRRKP